MFSNRLRRLPIARPRVLACAVATVVLSLGSTSSALAQSQWISTDSTEYSAGESVTIIGRGFEAHQVMAVQVLHADGTVEAGMSHEPFTVPAASDGTWTVTWVIAAADRAGDDFVVRVTTASGTDTTSFTRVARLQTDKRDYQPGETARIAGTDFNPNESVTLQVVHLIGGNDTGSGHVPFSATADGGGRVAASWFVDPDDSHGSTFRLTARGAESSRIGSMTFTDAVGTPPDGTADVVYGQLGSFTTRNSAVISADSLVSPGGVLVDGSGNVYIADTTNSRVLFYPSGSTTGTRVYGQNGSFTTGQGNSGGNPNANNLLFPESVALDSGGNLYIADRNDNRVLVYPPGSTTAIRSYGQRGSLTTTLVNLGQAAAIADGLHAPFAVALDAEDNLYIADAGNHRVVFYPAGSTVPTRVYGQPDFTSNTALVVPSASSLQSPWGLALDKTGNLYVADTSNSRVLFFPAGSTTATRVYGQPGFTTRNVGATDHNFNAPNGLALDRQNNLYVVDTGNNRVLFFPSLSTTATQVYGQSNFSNNVPNRGLGVPSALTLWTPKAATLDRLGNLFVVDRGNHRVLEYTRPPDLISPTASPAPLPTANANGWNNTDVTVTWNWVDNDGGTGVDDDHCTTHTTSSGQGSALILTANCADVAGNAGTAAYTLQVDKTRPIPTPSQTPSANLAGWNNSDVTVTWNWNDESGGSGLDAATCQATSASTAEGNPIAIGATCSDLAGNVDIESYQVRVDKTAPAPLSISQVPPANPAGWNNTDVIVNWVWADAGGSGVDANHCATTTTSLGQGAALTLTAACSDVASNAGASTVTVKVDKTAPLASLIGGPANGQTYILGSVPPAPTCSASDALSGVAGVCSVSGYGTDVGPHTITAMALDNAGNQVIVPASYTVATAHQTVLGFYQPVDMGGVWNVVKGGATVPLKFEVFSGSVELTDTSIVKPLRATEMACTGGATDDVELFATGTTSLRYDATAGQFIYNWQTPKKPGFCYVVTLSTTGGATLTAQFRLK